MAPKVLVYAAVSADGYTEGFKPDEEQFYRLIQGEGEDVALAGSNTILAVPGAEPDSNEPDAGSAVRAEGPLLAVIDSRGRVKVWDWLRRQPHWRDVIVIGSHSTPEPARREWDRRGLQQIITGNDRVDLAEALKQLGQQYGARTIRIESGGTLNGLLLAQGLVDEIAMLMHPVAVGGSGRRSLLCGGGKSDSDSGHDLDLISVERLDRGLIHIRFAVRR